MRKNVLKVCRTVYTPYGQTQPPRVYTQQLLLLLTFALLCPPSFSSSACQESAMSLEMGVERRKDWGDLRQRAGTSGWVRGHSKPGLGPDRATWLWARSHSGLQSQILHRVCDHSKIKHDWFLCKADGGRNVETVNPEREAAFVMWGRSSRKQSPCGRRRLVGRWQLEGEGKAGAWPEPPVRVRAGSRLDLAVINHSHEYPPPKKKVEGKDR